MMKNLAEKIGFEESVDDKLIRIYTNQSILVFLKTFLAIFLIISKSKSLHN